MLSPMSQPAAFAHSYSVAQCQRPGRRLPREKKFETKMWHLPRITLPPTNQAKAVLQEKLPSWNHLDDNSKSIVLRLNAHVQGAVGPSLKPFDEEAGNCIIGLQPPQTFRVSLKTWMIFLNIALISFFRTTWSIWYRKHWTRGTALSRQKRLSAFKPKRRIRLISDHRGSVSEKLAKRQARYLFLRFWAYADNIKAELKKHWCFLCFVNV